MINKQRNIAFKLIALFFAVAFINVSLSPDLPKHEEPCISEITTCHSQDESEGFLTQVLEVGWDIYQAIPETQTSQKEEQNYKKCNTDWFCDAYPCLLTSLWVDGPLHNTLFLNIDFRDYIKEVIPPPPKA